MRKLVCPPGAETLGINLHAFSDNLQGDELQAIMEKHQIVNLEPMGWYPMSRLMNALNEIAAMGNSSVRYVAIGKKIGEVTPIAEDIENPTLVDALNGWNETYQNIHRGGDVGEIVVKQIAINHYMTIHNDPYPDDMSYGILYAYGRRFLPPDTAYKVYYDKENLPRDYGGNSDKTIIHIEWE